MMDRMYDLSWEIAGDTIQLEQDAGYGEVSRVDLHTCQLRLLAERAGLLGAHAQTEGERRQEGLIRVLLRKLIELQGVIHEQRDYEPEIWLRLPLILELAGFLFEGITHERPFEDPDDDAGNGQGAPKDDDAGQAPAQPRLC